MLSVMTTLQSNDKSVLPEAAMDAIARVWGYTELRPLQAEAIAAALNNRDALVVLPTGGGKSLCYQVPPLVSEGLTVVVSPLISLMKDQVDGLVLNGYAAAGLHSGCSFEEQQATREGVESGQIKLLFVSPERLLASGFVPWLRELPERGRGVRVRRFAIDEAHCISHWGHDFRPEYRRLASVRKQFPGASVHALTATATERVRTDIIKQLGLTDPAVLVGTFDRPNLVYRVVPRVNRDAQIAEVIGRHKDEATIVYCISRKDTEEVAASLVRLGVKARAYHAGLDTEKRNKIQEAFSREKLDVVVATVAFGMGIDRSNVRCVIHAGLPKSVEAYQQETGRAGRDGLESECVLLYSGGDAMRWTKLFTRSAEESGSPPEVLAAQMKLLDEMHRVAAGMNCRHKSLSEHFDQEYEADSCDACDVCLKEIDTLADGTVVAQKIISCVARAVKHSGISFGAAHIADVLRGSKARAVLERGHDSLSTYGLLREMPKAQLVSLIGQLVDLGVLGRAQGQFPTLELTEDSLAVLRGEREVALFSPPMKVEETKAAGQVELKPEEQALFDALRGLRRQIADERDVPPYVVFSDATLRELAAYRPGSAEGFVKIRGVGSSKLESFGEAFLSFIGSWCAENSMELDAAEKRSAAPATGAKITAGMLKAFPMFAERRSVDEVAESLGLATSTVWGYLNDWVRLEEPADISAWVGADEYRRVLDAAKDSEDGRLKPIFESLSGAVSYGRIRMVLTHRATVGVGGGPNG